MSTTKQGTTKKAVAGEVATMSALVQRRAEIGTRFDQVIDEFGQLYDDLVQVQGEIWRRIYQMGVHGVAAPYFWLEGVTTVESAVQLEVVDGPDGSDAGAGGSVGV